MDYFVWTRIITPLAVLIFVIYVIISANRSYKAIAKKKREGNSGVDASVSSEGDVPPFMENFEEFPAETPLAQETVERAEGDIPSVAGQSAVETVQAEKQIEPPPVPVDSPTPLPTKPLPATSLLNLSPETFRQGIILKEILGRPKTLRSRRR